MSTFFITGSDTDVGKTYITTYLLKLLVDKGYQTRAIKPIETGFNYSDNDHASSQTKGAPIGSDVHAYQQVNTNNNYPPAYYFDVPASPHYSARLAHEQVDIDVIEQYCLGHIQQAQITLIEGAGGLLVPFNDSDSSNKSYNFTHLIKRLHCPIILVVKNQLGAINQALTNIQLCEFHGIDIACVVMNQTDPNDDLALENIVFVQSQTDIPVIQIDKDSSFEQFADRFMPIVESLVIESVKVPFFSKQGVGEINNPPKSPFTKGGLKLNFDKTHLWHPYTSMTQPLTAYHVQYAEGKYIYLNDEGEDPLVGKEPIGGGGSKKLLEGMGSWWAVNQGYNRDDLNKSAIRQINQFSHVMFGGLTHNPAIELGEILLEILPSGLEHIFYADSGSVSVEVAIKMALQYQQATHSSQSTEPLYNSTLSEGEQLTDPLLTSLRRETAEHCSAPTQDESYARSTGGGTKKTKILTPMGGYHGDTFGAMSVCDPINGMHGLFRNMLAEQVFIPRPSCRYDEPFDEQCLEPLKQALTKHQGEIAGVIIEPLVQGAGGMWFYHAEYLRCLRKVCDEQDIVLIFDEIATGFGRTGAMFASELAGVTPDIICLGKAITGGFMSFACTVTNSKVANGISQDGNPFMHGPTFMGNPLACAVAKTAIDSLRHTDWQSNVQNIEQWLTEGLMPCRELATVADVRVLGAIGVVEMHEPVDMQSVQAYFIQQGVWLRPFGKLIYTMPHFNFNKVDIEKICGAIRGMNENKS